MEQESPVLFGHEHLFGHEICDYVTLLLLKHSSQLFLNQLSFLFSWLGTTTSGVSPYVVSYEVGEIKQGEKCV